MENFIFCAVTSSNIFSQKKKLFLSSETADETSANGNW